MELQQSPMLVYSAKWENQQEWMKNVHEEIWKFTSSNSSNGYNGTMSRKNMICSWDCWIIIQWYHHHGWNGIYGI